MDPATGFAGWRDVHPKTRTEWRYDAPTKQVLYESVVQKTIRQETHNNQYPVDVAVAFKSIAQKAQALRKPRTQRQKVPSEETHLA